MPSAVRADAFLAAIPGALASVPLSATQKRGVRGYRFVPRGGTPRSVISYADRHDHIPVLNSSILGGGSASRVIVEDAVRRLLEASPGATVVHRDLGAAPVPHISGSCGREGQGCSNGDEQSRGGGLASRESRLDHFERRPKRIKEAQRLIGAGPRSATLKTRNLLTEPRLPALMSCQINLSPFQLACPSRPTMMWSCNAIPSGFATAMICCVMRTSACDGVGSPKGWLWINIADTCRLAAASGGVVRHSKSRPSRSAQGHLYRFDDVCAMSGPPPIAAYCCAARSI
jgi:hypothetical protein